MGTIDVEYCGYEEACGNLEQCEKRPTRHMILAHTQTTYYNTNFRQQDVEFRGSGV